eukprot:TRINITY_DN15160_c0_g1_i1.p1 TRINITY_DN15160_c0_g1~~TRINITY_DN15160_c0_g1_i1.p1  ORF type:complete len:534 (+),score=130.51 TRINITY_DN15160_c0_g1_i1:102-1703(+)
MSAELREGLHTTDWEALFAEGKTKFKVEKSWFASEERCEVLRRLCSKYKARRVLEVGACCGLSSLSMAEVLPEDGAVVSLEIDPFLAEFGQKYIDRSKYGKKINFIVGDAMESLRQIAKDCFDGKCLPFDFLMIDADRAGMMDYFNLFWWESPNLLGERATVCIDITPYKGQAPKLKSGPSSGDLQGDIWVVPSGQDQIDSVRRTLEASDKHKVYTVANLLVSHTREKGKEVETESCLSTPRREHPGGPWKARNVSSGMNPLASFPNDKLPKSNQARWAVTKLSDPASSLRAAVKATDWHELYMDGKTMTLVQIDWLGSEDRCGLLKCMMSAAKASNVLEIGGFCGMSSLAMAEELPDNGHLVSLEIDPYLVKFGEHYRRGSLAGQKIDCMTGPAHETLRRLAERAKIEGDNFKAFDFVVIDADRANVREYFNLVWDSPGLFKKSGIVCVDITPFKGQTPVRHKRVVPSGQREEEKQDEWIVPSGQAEVDDLIHYLEHSKRHLCYKVSGLLVVKSAPATAEAPANGAKGGGYA